jgi:hypothetical protein
MHIRETRLARLQELLADYGGSKKALAAAVGKAPAQVSQWCNGVRTITEESARDMERSAKLPAMWFDHPPASVSTGAGLLAYVAREAAPGTPRWPFPRIDPLKVARLDARAIHDIETAMMGAASVLGVQIGKRRAA